jgi:CRISPR system Cascade subunit CasE
MYLSKVTLDLHKPETAISMVRPSRMHGAVERSFSGGRQHAIWRIDRQGSEAVLLVLSNDRPDLTSLQEQFGTVGLIPVTKDYDGFLNSVREGGRYYFRLTANPTVKVNGKRVPMVLGGASKYGNTADWARSRLEKSGYSVDALEITEHRNVVFTRDNGQRVQFLQATFDGSCTVTDACAARETLQKGIGHEKAYGCGMMTLFPDG